MSGGSGSWCLVLSIGLAHGLQVLAVDQVDDDFADGLFLGRLALRDEQRERHRGIVGQSLGAVGPI